MLYLANLPNYLWGEVLLTSVFLYNRTLYLATGFKTPYELKYGRKPDTSIVRVFGSIAYYKAKGSNTSKLSPKAKKALLLGYTNNAEVYKLWDIELRKIDYSRDV